MYVLIDIEWVQKGSNYTITQFAANRVTDAWERTAEFGCLVCPLDRQSVDWEHMAYSGYSPDEFLAGSNERECIDAFARFLEPEDVICCWQKDTGKLLHKKYGLYCCKALSNQIVSLNHLVYASAASRRVKVHGMYAVAEGLGLKVPTPMHRSTNDLSVMRELLQTLNCRNVGRAPEMAERIRKTTAKRGRNAEILAKVQYRYIYTPDSQIFHRRSCKSMLNANSIQGCVFYDTAAKKRRPCKLCKPVPDEPETPSPQAGPKAGKQADRTLQPRKDPSLPVRKSDVIVARLLGDLRVTISRKKLVGYCHNIIHPGNLTRQLMDGHDCIKKQCPFFEKYPDSSFWIAEEERKREKDKRKKARQAQRAAAQRIEEELNRLQTLFQSYIDDAGYSMLIVKLEQVRSNVYKIFYVSEYPFADGNRFPDFLQTVKSTFPQYRIDLRHIRDVDGHFVTVDEYLDRVGGSVIL